ncbi:PTS cellobiose transporter subunit IIB [Enterococcus sp. LJL120]
MKKALIICAGGMSSSVIAKKATDYFKEQGKEIELDATSATQGATKIAQDEYDLYLVSPQTKMYFDNLKKAADGKNKPITNIPPQAYVPIPMAIEKLAAVVESNLA